MRRSKLEVYIDVLKVLAHHGPSKLTPIMYEANLNYDVLKDHLDFLIKQNLVEGQKLEKSRVVYTATQRGITVLKYFKEIQQVLPILEETRNAISISY